MRGKHSAKKIDPQISPDTLNKYFCSVGNTLQKDIKAIYDPLGNLKNINIEENLILYVTNITEIIEVIRSIKNKSSSSIDGIPLKVLETLPLK